MAEAITAYPHDVWTGTNSDRTPAYTIEHGRQATSIDERRDYGQLLLENALRDLDLARTYKHTVAARKRLVSLAADVADAAAKKLGYSQSPDYTAVVEDILVHGLDPDDAIRRARRAAMIETPDETTIIELGSWASVFAAYLQSRTVADQHAKDRLYRAILELSYHQDITVRIEAIGGLERIADLYPDVLERLQSIADEEDNTLVASEARAVLDDL